MQFKISGEWFHRLGAAAEQLHHHPLIPAEPTNHCLPTSCRSVRARSGIG